MASATVLLIRVAEPEMISSPVSFGLDSVYGESVCVSPFPNVKCWSCDSIEGSFPVVSAFFNHSLTQIWSLLNPNPDLASWLAAAQTAEWMVQISSWSGGKLESFMAQLFFFFFFHPNLISVTAFVIVTADVSIFLSLSLSVSLVVMPMSCNSELDWLILKPHVVPMSWTYVTSTLVQYRHVSPSVYSRWIDADMHSRAPDTHMHRGYVKLN